MYVQNENESYKVGHNIKYNHINN